MAERVRITWNELAMRGEAPWNVYDDKGKLLISSGQKLNKGMLDNLAHYILYRDEREDYGGLKVKTGTNAFEKFKELVWRLENVFEDIEEKNPDCKEKVLHLVKDILMLVEDETDATLACVLLPHDYPYTLSHPIQCAIICAVMSSHLSLPKHEKEMLIAAALVCNISIRDLQEELLDTKEELTEEQKDEVRHHPLSSSRMLIDAGFGDGVMHSIIMGHHERCDGSGYPRGTFYHEIAKGALILAIADSYCAMVTDRHYVAITSVKDALSQLLLDKGELYGSKYEMLLIKEMSIFPPGCFVRLTNGEIAIVIKRGKQNPMQPMVKSLFGPDKQRYANPLVRDCSINAYEIAGILGKVPDIPLNTSKLWDYV